MRSWVSIAALLVFSQSGVQVCAASGDNRPPSPDAIAALEARANQAPPREQCFLYAQLIQQMTELSIRQSAAGDFEKAANLLQQVQHIAQKLHLSLADNDKRLKDAEILLNHSVFRLKEMVHASNIDERPLVERTLAEVTQAQNATMMQVFHK